MLAFLLLVTAIAAFGTGRWRYSIGLLLATAAVGVVMHYVPDPSDISVAPVPAWAIFVRAVVDMAAIGVIAAAIARLIRASHSTDSYHDETEGD